MIIPIVGLTFQVLQAMGSIGQSFRAGCGRRWYGQRTHKGNCKCKAENPGDAHAAMLARSG